MPEAVIEPQIIGETGLRQAQKVLREIEGFRQGNASRSGRKQAMEYLGQGGFPRAVFTDEKMDLRWSQIQTDVFQGRPLGAGIAESDAAATEQVSQSSLPSTSSPFFTRMISSSMAARMSAGTKFTYASLFRA
jgi:predicted AAA+ superfamily ATPase